MLSLNKTNVIILVYMYHRTERGKKRKFICFIFTSDEEQQKRRKIKQKKEKHTRTHAHERTSLLLEIDTVTRAKQNFLFFDYFIKFGGGEIIINSMECKQIGEKQKQKSRKMKRREKKPRSN